MSRRPEAIPTMRGERTAWPFGSLQARYSVSSYFVPKLAVPDAPVRHNLPDVADRHKLRNGGKAQPGLGDPMQLLARKAGGRVTVTGLLPATMGDGRYDPGRRFLHGLISNKLGK
jgi:hypothetical protein